MLPDHSDVSVSQSIDQSKPTTKLISQQITSDSSDKKHHDIVPVTYESIKQLVRNSSPSISEASLYSPSSDDLNMEVEIAMWNYKPSRSSIDARLNVKSQEIQRIAFRKIAVAHKEFEKCWDIGPADRNSVLNQSDNHRSSGRN